MPAAARQLLRSAPQHPRRSLRLVEGTGGRPHGKRTKYVHEECRCDACTSANWHDEQTRRRRRTAAYVPAGPVREHLRWLASRGVGSRTIAERSGVPRSLVREIRAGRQRRLRPSTGEQLLAVRLDDVADGALVDAGETLRLVEQLVAAGRTPAWIARRLGSTAERPVLQLRGDRITNAKARAIAAIARQEGIV